MEVILCRQGGFNQIVRPNQTSSAILGRFFDTASRKITISKDREYEPKRIRTGIPKGAEIYDLTGPEDLIFQGPKQNVVIKQEEQEQTGNTDELKDNELNDTGFADLTTENVDTAKKLPKKNNSETKTNGQEQEQEKERRGETNLESDNGTRTLLVDPKAAEIILEQQINEPEEKKIVDEMNKNSEIATKETLQNLEKALDETEQKREEDTENKKEDEIVEQAKETIDDKPPEIVDSEEEEEYEGDITEEEEYPQEEEQTDKEEEEKEKRQIAKEEAKVILDKDIVVKGQVKGAEHYNLLFFGDIPEEKAPEDHGVPKEYHTALHDYVAKLTKQVTAFKNRKDGIKNTVWKLDVGKKPFMGRDMQFLLRAHKFYHIKEEKTRKLLREAKLEKAEVAEEIKETNKKKKSNKQISINTVTGSENRTPKGNPNENNRVTKNQFKNDYTHPYQNMQESAIDNHNSEQGNENENRNEEKIYYFKKPLSIIVIVHNHYFHFGMVFTGTKYDNEYDYLPDDKVVEGWNEQVFQKYVKFLEEKKKEFGDNFPPNFIILDDLIGKLTKSPMFTNFICCIRHMNCTLIMCTQYLRKATSTELRENIDMAFIFGTKFGLTIDGLFEAFGALFGDPKEFQRVLSSVAKEPYACSCI
ncbi:hypothetical protein RFI_34243 [Reticulomyxa filosa]|uniref:Uncharacterized protein n=2 Tax=Reticulomyxa filosa TaxID=46433 RepID=X6LP47_RETFI|nr:hypothetical protein RFI_34243 [Reticulomyxa filosa]|eukprot:ETO03166.1 hypothetical protein RFI_34243 [Reticulomyxa filosa]